MQTLENANKTKQTIIPGYWIYIMMLILSTKTIYIKFMTCKHLPKNGSHLQSITGLEIYMMPILSTKTLYKVLDMQDLLKMDALKV